MVRVDFFPTMLSSITALDFPSRLLADLLVRARRRRWMAWFSSVKIDSDPDANKT
jgi:hypothetical protein